MKFLISLTLLINFSVNLFGPSALAEIPLPEIPHYKIYPQTPPIEYQEAILDFYSVKTAYGEFSNFALFPIVIEGLLWPTSEHYYQAQKFFDPLLKEQVRAAASPFLAAQIGRDPNLPMRDDWDDVRDGFMMIALKAKFSQYDVLRTLLRSTLKSHIYEHTKNDCYWGDCGDRTGQNKLGQQLMQIRAEISI